MTCDYFCCCCACGDANTACMRMRVSISHVPPSPVLRRARPGPTEILEEVLEEGAVIRATAPPAHVICTHVLTRTLCVASSVSHLTLAKLRLSVAVVQVRRRFLSPLSLPATIIFPQGDHPPPRPITSTGTCYRLICRTICCSGHSLIHSAHRHQEPTRIFLLLLLHHHHHIRFIHRLPPDASLHRAHCTPRSGISIQTPSQPPLNP